MDKDLILFERQNVEVFRKLSEFKVQQEELKKQEEVLKAYLEKEMAKHGIKSLKNDYITISYVEASTTTSVDIKKLEEKEPDLFKELLTDYPKVTNKKAYVRFTVK